MRLMAMAQAASIAVASFVLIGAKPARGVDSASEHLYRVLNTAGHVKAFPLSANRWYAVNAGDVFVDGTLIQVSEGGRLSLAISRQGQIGTLDGDSTRLDVRRPMVFRLGRDPLRKVDLNPFFISSLPDKVLSKDAPPTALLSTISEAWSRFAAIFYSEDQILQKDTLTSDRAAVLSMKAKPMRLLSPLDRSVHVTASFPKVIRVTWEPVRGIDRYQLFVWRADEPRRSPRATTRLTRHDVTIDGEGMYFFQIMSEDRAWQSRPHLAHVIFPLALAAEGLGAEAPSAVPSALLSKAGKAIEPTGIRVSGALKLLTPPPEFLLVSPTAPKAGVEVDFSWRLARTLGADEYFEIIGFRDDAPNAEPVFRQISSETSLRLPLKVARGGLRWRVTLSRRNKDATKLLMASEWRRLEVTRDDGKTSPVSFISSDRSRHVYWDPGGSIDLAP